MLEEKIKEKIYLKMEGLREELQYTIEHLCEMQSSFCTISYLMLLLDSDNKQE